MIDNNDLELAKDLDYEKQAQDEESPFVRYDITSYPSDYTLSVLWQMFKNGDITIPSFQRNFVWTQKQASSLIESFLMGLPVPSIFFYIDSSNKNLVIDGQQRLLSVFFFFEGYFGPENEKGKRQTFRLTGLNKKSPYYNLRFDEMQDVDKRKLEMTVLRAINIRQLSPVVDDSCMYHIFERLNTGGTPLSSQEIRNCVYRGPFMDMLIESNIEVLSGPLTEKGLLGSFSTITLQASGKTPLNLRISSFTEFLYRDDTLLRKPFIGLSYSASI